MSNALYLAQFVGMALLGIPAHELAHWLVWKIAGRKPSFSLSEVRPRAGPTRTTPADRLAAAAPYLTGVGAAVVGVVAGEVLLLVFGAVMVCRPSRVDLAAMRGRVEWAMVESP